MWTYVLLAPFSLFFAYRACNLLRNYLAARRYSVPIILLPVSFEDAWWIPLRPLFSWVERLPFNLGSWYIFTTMGWPTEDEYRTVSRLGETFVLCSPTRNTIATCYPPALQKVFGEHKNWPQPESQSQMFAFYGQNVSSTNGAEWQRHRKITARAFSEATCREAWQETVRRVKSVDFERESERTLGRVRTTFDLLAMQVLANVGFGQDIELTSVPPGHRESLMGSLGFILEHVMLTLVFNSLKAPDIMLPGILKRLKVSVAEFRLYMKEAVLRHMQASKTKTDQPGRTSLLEAMVKANEAEKQQLQKTTSRPSYLTESELYGNIFVFNLAGYETTASTLTFALPYLAAHPETQDWVIEEVDRYYVQRSTDDEYENTYPKLVRCLAVMHETLRLASPAPLLVRSPNEPTELPVSTSDGPTTVTVDPGTLVGGNFYGAHLSSRWGPDAETFDPKRFVSISSAGEERVAVPEGPMYCPWIFGTRVCPGKKFSQVEFVALIAQIMSEWKIDVLRLEGEDEQVARGRLMGVLKEKYFNISTHLKRPEDAGVRFVRRRRAHV
ncbi:putative cytochrome P450 [Trematosphaeria pertusa]|uniref:Putative cytochrome P450 n=1 Tax=Trematosphaeria pertusa TaxID=390896 RepID=A0A6A6IRI5_9PLEO|nr:putative cytochrome P450 [Trematosphaeria pertusa]KAF2252133.1 putative cytochrome P450 [Trematosphaeria pertusa]